MTSSLQKIIESKRVLRREFASRPIAEKLRMLEMMRDREVSIRGRNAADPQTQTPL